MIENNENKNSLKLTIRSNNQKNSRYGNDMGNSLENEDLVPILKDLKESQHHQIVNSLERDSNVKQDNLNIHNTSNKENQEVSKSNLNKEKFIDLKNNIEQLNSNTYENLNDNDEIKSSIVREIASNRKFKTFENTNQTSKEQLINEEQLFKSILNIKDNLVNNSSDKTLVQVGSVDMHLETQNILTITSGALEFLNTNTIDLANMNPYLLTEWMIRKLDKLIISRQLNSNRVTMEYSNIQINKGKCKDKKIKINNPDDHNKTLRVISQDKRVVQPKQELIQIKAKSSDYIKFRIETSSLNKDKKQSIKLLIINENSKLEELLLFKIKIL